jgi:hypothetical protein
MVDIRKRLPKGPSGLTIVVGLSQVLASVEEFEANDLLVQ